MLSDSETTDELRGLAAAEAAAEGLLAASTFRWPLSTKQSLLLHSLGNQCITPINKGHPVLKH